MKVRATWEFEVDEKDFDPKFVEVEELAIYLTEKELEYLLSHNELKAKDFEYEVVKED
jgi:hypothetical protein